MTLKDHALVLLTAAWMVHPASAEIVGGTVKIGILTDFTTSNAAWSGKGSVVAADMAVEDFKKAHPNLPYKVEVLQADFQLKSDLAIAIARKWIDEGVNAVVDMPFSSAALAVKGALKDGPAAILVTGAYSDDLTTKECAANMVHWVYDSSSNAVPPLRAMLQSGLNSWYFVTVEGAGGKASEDSVAKVVLENGGKIVGGVKTPVDTADYSSFLLQAQASKAKVIGLLNSGSNLVVALKQADEFGLRDGRQIIHVPSLRINEVEAMGLKLARGLLYVDAFYHDVDEGKRALTKRFAERMGADTVFSSDQAGIYSAVTHYLKAVDDAKSNNGPIVVSKMKELPVADPLLGPGKVRIDGRMVHDMYLLKVKEPAESKSRWDLAKVVRVIPGDEAFRPMSKACYLVQ